MINHYYTSKGTFTNDGGLMGDGIWLGVGPCHGMALRATDDGMVGTRHGVSPPHGVSPSHVVFNGNRVL